MMPQLTFVAFDHLFVPNQMIPTNHILYSMKISRRSSARPPQMPSIHAALEAV
jgi:hypothetical protein